MDRTQLLQHFDTLAETPNAPAKMRELVLELAELGTFGGTDAKKVPLHSVAEFVMGQAPAGTECNETGEGTIFVKAGEFGPLYAQVRCWTTRPLKFARKGDVLICVVGATVGKLNLAIDSAIGRSVAAIRPSEQLDTRFLYYSLMPFTLRLRRASRGSAQGVIGREELRGINISFPPLAEQRRIVAKVEELLALCDALAARQTAASEHRTRLVRSALAHLTTANGARLSPAAAASPRSKASGLSDAPTPLPRAAGRETRAPTETDFRRHAAFVLNTFPDLTAAPEDVPALRQAILSLAVQGRLSARGQSLKQTPLGELLAEPSLNGVSKAPSQSPPGVEILRISAGTSRRDSFVNEDDFKFVELSKKELEKFRLRPNDLLACRFNGNLHFVGRVSLYRGVSGRVQVNPDKLIRFRVDESRFLPRYVRYAMNAQLTRAQIETMCATTAGNIGISASELKGVAIPVPPLAEQQRIVGKVEELLRWCDALEARLTAARTTATHLLDATLHPILTVVSS